MKATIYGEYLEEEFNRGCAVNSADTIEKWTAVVPKLREKLKEKSVFKDVYRFAGQYACEK